MATAAVSSNQVEGSPATDRAALVAFFKATNGLHWINVEGWCSKADLKDWHGVDVNGQGRVIMLRLRNNNLQGRIPRELGNLSRLTSLLLAVNGLTGSIPTELGNLAQLQELSLDDNSITGDIPRELGRLRMMQSISLNRNELEGNIPVELGLLPKLTRLWLKNNKLKGASDINTCLRAFRRTYAANNTTKHALM